MIGINDWGFLPNPGSGREPYVCVDEPMDKVYPVTTKPSPRKLDEIMEVAWNENSYNPANC